MAPSAPIPAPRLGVSGCLLGDAVRYDGTHRRFSWVTDALAPHVRLVPVCPEVEAGMGVPREPVRLEGDPPRMVGVHSRRDVTAAMERVAKSRVRGFRRLDLAGYVFKKGSPSCGPVGVPRFEPGADASNPITGPGLFAAAVREAFRELPMVDETHLEDRQIRTAFSVRIFLYACWRRFARTRFSRDGLSAFHRIHAPLIRELDLDAADTLDAQLRGPRMDAESARFAYADVFHRALDRPMDRGAVMGKLECPACLRWESVKHAA